MPAPGPKAGDGRFRQPHGAVEFGEVALRGEIGRKSADRHIAPDAGVVEVIVLHPQVAALALLRYGIAERCRPTAGLVQIARASLVNAAATCSGAGTSAASS